MTTKLTISDYRRAEAVPGGPDRDPWIHVSDGTLTASVMVHHYNIDFATLVADAIVEVLPDATRAIADARERASAAKAHAERAEGRAQIEAAKLDAVLHGSRRVWGEALVRVTDTGHAWLLDPVKQERGFGLCFDSLEELWRAYPELRPVRWSDGDLIVGQTIALGGSDGARPGARDRGGNVGGGQAR